MVTDMGRWSTFNSFLSTKHTLLNKTNYNLMDKTSKLFAMCPSIRLPDSLNRHERKMRSHLSKRGIQQNEFKVGVKKYNGSQGKILDKYII